MPDSTELKDNSLDALCCWHLAFYSPFLTCFPGLIKENEDFIAFGLIPSSLSQEWGVYLLSTPPFQFPLAVKIIVILTLNCLQNQVQTHTVPGLGRSLEDPESGAWIFR